jgi:outer membrane protein W
MKKKMGSGYLKKAVIVLSLSGQSLLALAQGPDPLIVDTLSDPSLSVQNNEVNVYNSDQIDVNGSYGQTKQKEELTSEEIVSRAQNKAEMENVKVIAKKIEKLRIPRKKVKKIANKQKVELEKRLGEMFGSFGPDEEVQKAPKVPVQIQAVPVVSETKIEPRKSSLQERPIKVTPTIGLLNIQGNGANFESKFNGGLTVDAMVSNRFSIGFGASYSTMDIKEIDPNLGYGHYQANYYPSYGAYYPNSYGNYNSYYGANYYYPNYYSYAPYSSFYGTSEREMKYKHLACEVNSKFYLMTDGIARPYVGAALGYNRVSLEYEDQREVSVYHNYYNQYRNYGGENYTSSYISGGAMVGSEFAFTDSVGLNVELRYDRGLTKGFSTEMSGYGNEDRYRLEAVGKTIEESNFYSGNLGMFVRF